MAATKRRLATPSTTWLFVDIDITTPSAHPSTWDDLTLISFIDAFEGDVRHAEAEGVHVFSLNACALAYFDAWIELHERTALPLEV